MPVIKGSLLDYPHGYIVVPIGPMHPTKWGASAGKFWTSLSSEDKAIVLAAWLEMQDAYKQLNGVQQYYALPGSVPVSCTVTVSPPGHKYCNALLVHSPDFNLVSLEMGMRMLAMFYGMIKQMKVQKIHMSPLSAGNFAGRHFDAIIKLAAKAAKDDMIHMYAFTDKEFLALSL